MLSIIEFTRGTRAKRVKVKGWKLSFRNFCASLIVTICLFNSVIASGNFQNNNFRSMPFIEMMVAMMKVMNQMMGNNNYVPGLGTLPYSPGMSMMPLASGLGGMNNFPMSPVNSMPLNSFMNSGGQNNFLSDKFQIGKNAQNFNNMNDFWNPQAFNKSSSGITNAYEKDSVNGIWQSLSGDVIAIYKNSYFMWTDGKSRRLSGRLFFKGNHLVAYFPVSKKKLHFQFYKEAGQFIVRDPTSRIYTFKRLH